MAPKKGAPPGGSGTPEKMVDLAGFDFPRDTAQAHKTQERRRRAGFARDIVFAEFGYQHARALDYPGFVDRTPTAAPVWWRAVS